MDYVAMGNEAVNHIKQLIQQQSCPNLHYHNLQHTESVAKAAQQIADHYQLNQEEYFIVTTAAWFHDMGYCQGKREGHEQAGAQLAEQFLLLQQVDAGIIEKVKGCIIATEMPQHATNLLEEIVCDADMFHLGTDEFPERNKLMRKEAEAVYQKEIPKDEWRKGTIALLQQHSYYTDYCKLLLNDKKQQHLEKLLNKQSAKNHLEKNIAPMQTETPTTPKDKGKEPSRGIETMFRITSGNNQRLSDMADNKAHILITVNSIILSAILSLLLRKLEEHSYLTYPTFCILAVSLATIVVCILATRPSIPKGEFTQQEIDDKKVNLLFFGNFYNMNLKDYTTGMLKVMADRDFLYGTLIKDVYSQGVVLGRKYKLLRMAYSIFMFGLVLSVMGFIVAVILENTKHGH
jgi:putative nucleotidyltransferase with HDIG domain